MGLSQQGASSVADLLFWRTSAASPSMPPHCGGKLPETLQGAPRQGGGLLADTQCAVQEQAGAGRHGSIQAESPSQVAEALQRQ